MNGKDALTHVFMFFTFLSFYLPSLFFFYFVKLVVTLLRGRKYLEHVCRTTLWWVALKVKRNLAENSTGGLYFDGRIKLTGLHFTGWDSVIIMGQCSLMWFAPCSTSWRLFSLTIRPPLHFTDVFTPALIWYFRTNAGNVHLNLIWTGVGPVFCMKALTRLVSSLDLSSWDGSMCMFSPLTPPTSPTAITISCPITPS